MDVRREIRIQIGDEKLFLGADHGVFEKSISQIETQHKLSKLRLSIYDLKATKDHSLHVWDHGPA